MPGNEARHFPVSPRLWQSNGGEPMKYRSSKRALALAITPEVKRIVHERDKGRCVYCGRYGLPEAHFIPRSKGGLGIEENILTLCRQCHDMFDHSRYRQNMREFFRKYLQSKYPEWEEEKLYYRRFQ